MQIARLTIEMAANVARMQRDMERASGIVRGAARTMTAALSGIGAGLSVQAFAQVADQVTTLENSLKLATGSTQAAKRAYADLLAVAQQSRVSFTDLGATYAQIARSTGEMGLSHSRLMTVTQAIGNAMTITGGTAESMNAALIQLSQGMASGTLRGEELNSIIEQTPRLAKAIADGLGVPIGKLREMGKAGELTAQQVIRALENQAAVLKGEVAGSTVTVSQAMTNLGNSTTDAIGKIDKATGASNLMAEAIRGVASAVDGMGNFVKEHQVAINTLIGVLTAGAAAVALVKIAAGLKAVAIGVGAIGVALAANPLTLALLGIGAAVGGFVAYNNAVSKTAEGMARTIRDLEDTNRRIEQSPYRRGPLSPAVQAQVDKNRETIRKLRVEMAQLSADGLDTSAEDARLSRYNAAAVAQAQQEKRVSDGLAKFNEQFASSQQKAQAEVDKWRTLLGAAFTPEMEAKVRATFTKGKDAVDALSKSVNSGLIDSYIALQVESQKLNGAQADFLKLAMSPEWAKLTEAQRVQIAQVFEQRIANEQATDSLKALADAQKDASKAYADHIKTYQDGAKSQADRLTQMEAEAEATRLASALQIDVAEAVEMVTIARLKEQQVAALGNEAIVLSLQAEIEAREKILKLLGDKRVQQAQTKLREDQAREWQKTWEQVSQSFTDTLMKGGKSVKDYLSDLFRTLVLRPILAPIGAAAAGLLMPGAASASALGAPGDGLSSALQLAKVAKDFGSNITTIFSRLGDNVAFAAESAGQWLVQNTTGLLNKLGGTLMGNSGLIGTISSWAGGIASGLGIGKAISGGYSAFGGSGNASVNAGTAIGAIFGPLGSAIGGAIGGIVNRAFGRKAPQVVDSGLVGSFGTQGASVQQFTQTLAKGGWFRSDKWRTTYNPITSELQQYLDSSLKGLSDSTRAFAVALGQDASAINGVTQSISLSLQGLSGEEAQKRIDAALGGFADRLASSYAIASFAKAGETASQTLARLGGSVLTVNAALDTLSQRMYSASIASGDMASKLLGLFGGADAFNQATGAYYQAFYSEQERTATTLRQLTAAFGELGVSLPQSKAGYRALVEAQDLTTEKGREMYAALLKLAPTFDSMTQAVERLSQTLTDEIRRLRGLLTQDSASPLVALQAQFAAATAAARAGDTSALERLPELSKAIESSAALTAVTAADLARMRGWLANSLSETMRTLGLNVPQFAVGANVIPHDMLAMVHKGEAIVPAAYNPALHGGDVAAEVRELRKDNAQLLARLEAIETNTRAGAIHGASTANTLRKATGEDGASIAISTRTGDAISTEAA